MGCCNLSLEIRTVTSCHVGKEVVEKQMWWHKEDTECAEQPGQRNRILNLECISVHTSSMG